MQQVTGQDSTLIRSTATTTPDQVFPFTMQDLDYIMVAREDGTVVKITFNNTRGGTISASHRASTSHTPSSKPHSYSAYCNHYPGHALPVFTTKGGDVALYIADYAGVRRDRRLFDLVIDGGAVLTDQFLASEAATARLKGDEELVDALIQYAANPTIGPNQEPRILSIDWDDRKAPPLATAFWPDLAKRLLKAKSRFTIKGENGKLIPGPFKVVTNCVGGHGRSGTALTALMMCYTDYTPYEAVCHLRAIHCPRAIESSVQHEYLNDLGIHLGREGNGALIGKVSDFKKEFLTLTNKWAKPYQARLEVIANAK